MYPNPHIVPTAGIYLKQVPNDLSHTEYYILRPDLLVEWSLIATDGSNFESKEMRGNWAINEDNLMIILLDDDTGESLTERYTRDGQNWRSTENAKILLVKRNAADDIKDQMYYDLR